MAGPYAGQDRRQGRSSARHTISSRELIAFAAALAIIGVGLPTVLEALPSFSTAAHAQGALRTAWAVLFVCAGIFRLVRWRLTGEARAALLGIGMVCFGLLAAPTAALAPLIQRDSTDVWLSPVTRVVAVTVFQLTLVRTFMAPTVNANVRPVRAIIRLMLAGAAVLAVFVTVENLVTPITIPPHVWFVIGTAQAGAWLAFAAAAGFTGNQRNDASTMWIGLGLLLMGTAEFLHALAFVSPPGIAFYATCLQLVAGTVAAANSATDLGLVLSADGNRMLSLSGALHDAELMLSDEEQLQAERLHDARSVICALKAASITLDRYDERLDTEVKHRLRSSLVSELSRLEQVIDGRRQESLQAFRLSTALGPLLTAERENGLSIEADLMDIAVVGRPLELATVVQNLLVNARRYADGSVVRVAARHFRQHVRIVVEDRGPGIDPTQQELVFERGHRCTADGNGSGLGLYLARRLMREQSGEVVVRDRVGGGASFVLTLPAPSWNQKIDDGVEVIDASDAHTDFLARDRDVASTSRLPRQRHDDAADKGARGRVGHDKIDQRALVGRADLEAT